MKFTYNGDAPSKKVQVSTGEVCELYKGVPQEVPDEVAAKLQNDPDFTNDRPFGPKPDNTLPTPPEPPKPDNTLPTPPEPPKVDNTLPKEPKEPKERKKPWQRDKDKDDE